MRPFRRSTPSFSTYVYTISPSVGNSERDRRSAPWRPPGSPKWGEVARGERRDHRGKHVGASISANDQHPPRAMRWGALCCGKKRVKDCEEEGFVSLPAFFRHDTPVPGWPGCGGFYRPCARQSQRFQFSRTFFEDSETDVLFKCCKMYLPP